MKKLREENPEALFLHLDAGGFADFYTDDGPIRTKAILEAYELMGVTAMNVTAREMSTMLVHPERVARDDADPNNGTASRGALAGGELNNTAARLTGTMLVHPERVAREDADPNNGTASRGTLAGEESRHDTDPEATRIIFDNYDIPFISANIVDEATGEPFFKPYVTVEAGGRTIGIVGVTERVLRTWEAPGGGTLTTADPFQSLGPVLEELRDECDMVILLAHVPIWQLNKHADGLQGIDIVNGADGITATVDAREIGGATVSYAGRQGQFLGVLNLTLDTDGAADIEHEMVRLETSLPEDNEVKKIVEQTKKEIEAGSTGSRN